ncbi:hypothetical protein LY01_00736 [Nonlabens xylanidelens]|uniref:N-acetyltransferase domain-containing protein n=1 Tax=Nonlabens xylanidelens TaxID=191564 RepID=A0A2S6IRV4_9FLAO|nr:GNAT family N-acetyltransferase [Nonlabens xylanidelens]PPK96911.1 hypothetical protein LY01_00736 [Nonlabens xylanidelens]PQJ13609.1 hypothetical protein BST94_14750 [Nonlabens xylanidelens]
MNYLLTGESTVRSTFRLLKREDYQTWLSIFKEEDTGRFLGMKQGLTAQEQCDVWFEKAFWRYDKGTSGMNVMIHKETNEFIGQSGLLVQTVNGLKKTRSRLFYFTSFLETGICKRGCSKVERPSI